MEIMRALLLLAFLLIVAVFIGANHAAHSEQQWLKRNVEVNYNGR